LLTPAYAAPGVLELIYSKLPIGAALFVIISSPDQAPLHGAFFLLNQ
jgi:hypothetical protein